MGSPGCIVVDSLSHSPRRFLPAVAIFSTFDFLGHGLRRPEVPLVVETLAGFGSDTCTKLGSQLYGSLDLFVWQFRFGFI